MNALAYAQQTPLVHAAIEWLAYAAGARVYARARRALPLGIDRSRQLLLLACTVAGAALGSVALHFAASFSTLSGLPLTRWIAGKSVLGGFLGGTLGTELGKRLTGVATPTGDAWVPALVTGLAIGRLGCQLSGTWDMTYGSPTGVAVGWDYGDGIARYPTGFIEIAAVLGIGWWLGRAVARPPGARFDLFLLSYSALRFLIEFLKPPYGPAAGPAAIAVERVAGLTAIQWAALAGILWMACRLHAKYKAD